MEAFEVQSPTVPIDLLWVHVHNGSFLSIDIVNK